jgi:hypothetical protein
VRRRAIIPAVLLLLALVGASLSQAEFSQQGNLRISFSGSFSPQLLPRDRPAPVTVAVRGAIGTTDGSHPPALKRFEIELNRAGIITTRGLPACTSAMLQTTSSETALQRCRPALVGRGQFKADVQFPTTAPVPAAGTLLAFYGHSGGHKAILLHLYGAAPVQATFVLPLTISHSGTGKFGTVFAAGIPTLAGGVGSVTEISLRIGRNYSYRGESLSFLSASCAAPKGFPGAVFSLARGKFFFADGRQIKTVLARNCRVR